ncbi:hydrolase [Shewanella sp. 10N.286.52.B9]|uniref:hydrolase n=1 Tax=Shewanella sp. 10N.286.52.B9 TaxID=1880837 RepID=UPI000C83122A|nr:hydrolase [Shewanella sp. 10N.286.52.B9]PMG43603.1 alpha/beta hydrolase [Shewanella sp. 10N.286.52.B9]
MKKIFTPPWWAVSPHIQTILPVLFKVAKPDTHRQRQELTDGDFIDLDWLGKPQNGQPILVILHGLEGSSESHYVRRMLQTAQNHGLCAVVHHHRSCSGEPNRLARSYHSGDTEDIHFTLTQLHQQYPESPLYAVGYSLGGNVLAKYQGEQGEQSLLEKTIIVSAPLWLAACAKKLEKGFSKIYQQHLIKQLQAKMHSKVLQSNLVEKMPVTEAQIQQLSTFYLFDDKVTAPLHGFADVNDYYQRASGKPFLKNVSKSTLVIHAQDDPFMTDDVIPAAVELSEHVEYELHPKGGHVGFISGGVPWKPRFYLESRIIHFLKS